MDVIAWNRQAEELWGLRSDEVIGQHFLNLDIGFPVEALRTAVRDCLSGRAERAQVVEQAVNRSGRAIDCAVSVSCLVGELAPRGVILMMEAVAMDRGGPPADGQRAGREATGLRVVDGQPTDRKQRANGEVARHDPPDDRGA